jgi:hypothetical protein
MPVSDIWNIAPILSEVQTLQPKTICDLGIGFGKYGVLCREVLDAVHGRVSAQEGKVFILGFEGFDDYSNPAWKCYDLVMIADFAKLHEVQYKAYLREHDLILMIDSLEHIEKAEGLALLRRLVKDNKQVIVSVPLGTCPQGAVFGNELERHRATYTGVEDFAEYNGRYKVLYQGVCLVLSIKGDYGN